MALIGRIKKDWQLFKASRPGYRFRDHYRRHRRRRRQRSPMQERFDFRKILFIVVGITIAITSIVLGPLPGPGLGTFLLGLVILASELRIAAHFLDWAEVILRRPARRAKGTWAGLTWWARILIGAGLWIGGVTLGLWVLLYGFR